MKKIAVLLSGCGVYDGSEIHEATLTLLSLHKLGCEVQCFAPDRDQFHVINHLAGEPIEQKRSILMESARIARGNVLAIDKINDSYDALIIPGGFGAAKNLCDFAINGENMKIQEDVKKFIHHFTEQKKPVGWMCISPMMMPLIYPNGVTGTIGNDKETSAIFNKLGGVHKDAEVNQVIIDENNKAVSTPAYMFDTSIDKVSEGIERLVKTVVEMA